MPRPWQRLALLFVAAGKCFAADYVGPDKCQSCHPAEFAAQSHSRHDSALRRIGDTPLPSLLADSPIRERSGVAFEYAPGTNSLSVAVTQGSKRLEASLEWAFGSGAQAYTPVGKRGGSYFEHRVSFYTSAGRPGRTLGHPGEASRSLESALGLVQSAETIYRCFNCHATGVAPGPDLSKMRAGVSCERCHGPGSEHVKNSDTKLKVDSAVQFCAQCHRSPAFTDSAVAPEVKDPLSIRFQPVGLMASKCFQRSGTLSCVTCHDPHEDARREPDSYVAKCVGCHAGASARLTASACGLSKRANCLPCHMERRSPADYLSFTDHRIRIYGNIPRNPAR